MSLWQDTYIRYKRATLFSHCVLPLDPRQWSFFSVDNNFESEAILTTWLLSSVAVVCQDWIMRSVINMSCLKRSNALGSRYNCYACSCTSMCTTYTLLKHIYAFSRISFCAMCDERICQGMTWWYITIQYNVLYLVQKSRPLWGLYRVLPCNKDLTEELQGVSKKSS